jgi:hypothetical protein
MHCRHRLSYVPWNSLNCVCPLSRASGIHICASVAGATGFVNLANILDDEDGDEQLQNAFANCKVAPKLIATATCCPTAMTWV